MSVRIVVPDTRDGRLRDAITSLSRIGAAVARLMGAMHSHGRARDFDEEVDHIKANLDRVVACIEAERAS